MFALPYILFIRLHRAALDARRKTRTWQYYLYSVAGHVLVPLGAVRTAFWSAHLVSMQDSDAFALCCAAWAHAAKPTGTGEAWITARREKRRPLGDAEIVVTALLAAGRGDAATCRELL